MKPIAFKQANVVYAKDQPEYLQLPAHRTDQGVVTCCWQLTLWETIKVSFTGRVWISMLTFNGPLQPLRPTINNPFTTKNEMPENP
jgi:hypothetical protein